LFDAVRKKAIGELNSNTNLERKKIMKSFGKKCILVVTALIIALGSASMLSGCKKKSAAPAETPKKAPAAPAE
jgi:hypothetical protein